MRRLVLTLALVTALAIPAAVSARVPLQRAPGNLPPQLGQWHSVLADQLPSRPGKASRASGRIAGDAFRKGATDNPPCCSVAVLNTVHVWDFRRYPFANVRRERGGGLSGGRLAPTRSRATIEVGSPRTRAELVEVADDGASAGEFDDAPLLLVTQRPASPRRGVRG
jgi:hypothetical protein